MTIYKHPTAAATERVTTKAEWIVLYRQLKAARAFWKRPRPSVCGAAWIADYGPLPCDRPHGHEARGDGHRTYGSQGVIEWREL